MTLLIMHLNIYRPDYFAIHELVPQAIYKQLGDRQHLLWQQLDPVLLWTADQLRKRYGPMVACDWHKGGHNHYRGWRHPACTIGAPYSQHRAGRALDLVPTDTMASIIRRDILIDPYAEIFQYITCIEDGVAWLHFDVRPWDKKKYGIMVVEP